MNAAGAICFCVFDLHRFALARAATVAVAVAAVFSLPRSP
jgi:hypothetical protein